VKIQHFFDEETGTLSYVVHDGRTGVVIDPVQNYDPRSGRTSWRSYEAVTTYAAGQGISLRYAIDTHVHADHMTGLQFFREHHGAQTVTGAGIGVIQKSFRELYHLGADFPVDSSQFDRLLNEGQVLNAGELQIEAIYTPGHTPAHMSWRVGDVVFLGDTLFMPDYGTARCDFPGGSAAELFDSAQRIYALPDDTQLFVCHDYQPGSRPLRFQTTVQEQKSGNVQLNAGTAKEAFVAFREQRDRGLSLPALLLPAMQVNIRAGRLPEAETNDIAYLKIPLNRLGSRNADC